MLLDKIMNITNAIMEVLLLACIEFKTGVRFTDVQGYITIFKPESCIATTIFQAI